MKIQTWIYYFNWGSGKKVQGNRKKGSRTGTQLSCEKKLVDYYLLFNRESDQNHG